MNDNQVSKAAAADFDRLTFLTADDAAEIFVQALLNVCGDEVTPVLGAVHDMKQQVRVCA